MSLALVFAGQGTQHAAMLPWLEDCAESAPALRLVQARFGANWRTRLADGPWSQTNAVAQPLLTGLALAAWQGLAGRLPQPVAVAGYSLGELAAYSAAGVFSAAEATGLSVFRAAAMDASTGGPATGLLSVQGLDAAALQAACAQHGLSLAIRLATDRAVVGGLSTDLLAAQAELSAAGARCVRLPVGIASHTPWMAAAATAFEARLEAVVFTAPRMPVVCNHGGAAEREPQRLKQLLARQLASPVPWDTCMDTLAERRARCVLEIGGGQALASLWRDRHPDIPARSADEFRSAAAVARWVDAQLQ